jgi:hypothetical protein
MKAIALTFNYDLQKLKSNGRYWAEEVYGNTTEIMFSYSAASYATFLDKNPNIKLCIYTDDVDLMERHMKMYNVDLSQVSYIDFNNILKKCQNSKFTFQPLVEMLLDAKKYNEYILKVDNDLVWNNALPKFDETNDILVWKYERVVKYGDPRMGEIKVCEKTIKFTELPIYNL